MHLIQKSLTHKKEIFIDIDSLLVKDKNIREDLEYKIKFEELGFDIVKKRIKTANILFYLFLLFDALYVYLILSSTSNQDPFSHQLIWVFGLLFFSVMTVIAYYNRNKNFIYLTGGQKVLELLATKPDVKSVNDFIETIHITMKQHYKSKFLKFDIDTPFEFRIHQLNWLKEIKVLTEEEYQKLLDNTKTDNIIGF
jgi:hypothetical protein